MPQNFGDQVTADHLIRQRKAVKLYDPNDDDPPDDDSDDPDALPHKAGAGLVIYDRATKWLALYPKQGKNAKGVVTNTNFMKAYESV